MNLLSFLDFKSSSELLMLMSFFFDFYLTFRAYWKIQKTTQLPEKFKKYEMLKLNSSEFQKNREYNIEKKQFQIVKSMFDFLFNFSFVFFNLIGALWNSIYRKHPGVYSPAYRYMFIMTLFSTAIESAFSYYNNFVIEQKHGFNKMTVKLFLSDLVKSFILENVFQFLAFGAILHCLETYQENFILFAWFSLVFLLCVYIFMYPTYIAPMFNKFENLNEEDPKEKQLSDALVKMCNELNFPLGHIYKIDGKTRSDHSQAYFFGFFGKKQIVIYDTLIEKVSVDEIVAVVGHELGHWYHSHNIMTICVSFANIGFVFYLFSHIVNNDAMYTDFGLINKSYFIGLIIFLMLYSPLSIITNALTCFMIRTNEYQADRFAVRLGKGNDLISGLVKLFKDNKGDLDPDEFVALFRHTHPDFIDRVEAIQAEMKKKA